MQKEEPSCTSTNASMALEDRASPWKVGGVLLGLVLLVWLASWVVVTKNLQGWEERAGFGDMFGAVNALFSGLALAGIVYAIFLQRQELELQREELRYTRLELARSADAQMQATVAFDQQVRVMAITALIAAETELVRASPIDSYGRLRGEERLRSLEAQISVLLGEDLLPGL